MSLMAEQVTNINTSASNLIDIVAAGTIQNSNEVLLQVTEAQNKLNDAWNQLADCVESRRYLMNLDHAFLDLCQDCSCTAEWIEDKLAILNRNAWNDISSLTQLTRLEYTLSSLQSDAKVIRAKVDNIYEQVLATYPASEGPLSERRKWLLEAHSGLCGRFAELERQLDQLKGLVSLYWGHLTSAQSLEEFSQWLSFFKTKRCSITVPSDLEEARRLLLEREQDLQELVEAEKRLGQLMVDYEKLVHSRSSSAVVDESRANPEQVLQEYAGTCDLVRENISTLKQIVDMQTLLAEAGSLEVAIRQQDAYLLKDDLFNSVEALEAALREHEAFVALMANCCNRLSLLESKSENIAAGQCDNGNRLVSKLRSLRERVEKNKKRTSERERALKENLRLQELLGDIMDIEDWIADKSVVLKQVTITSKRDIMSAYNQVRALQDEIEASRDRAEHIIRVGKQLIDSSPQYSHIVSLRIDDIVAHWEDLLKLLHCQMRKLEELHREYTMNEAVQNLMNWANNTISKVKANLEDSSLTTAGLADLQRRLESHQRDCQDFESYLEVADTIKSHSDALSQLFPSRSCDFLAVNIEVSKKLDSVDAALGHRESLLNFHSAIARHLLDLTLELLWVKDKLVQIRQPYTDWKPQDRRSAGCQLLRVHQAKRRLMNHIAEVENRGPRVKNLCQMMKEEYLQHTETAGSRIGRFSDILRELEQAWYTITYLLEVRREELRLADAIHKFCFDVINIEAWMSERELYLQGLQEPTNIGEAHRALRRLNVLQETVAHWANEIDRMEHRGNELLQELSSTVQINGECVAAPPVATTTVLEATKGVMVAFEHLKGSVQERRRDLTESITLHDVMQDINDLEEWIVARQKTANSYEIGDDLEHSFYLQDRFSQFAKNTQVEGARRLRAMLFRIDQLIARGHRNRNEIALGKDQLNEGWADLIEMIDTRKQLLRSSIEMHRFVSDTQYLEAQIHDCYQHMPIEPTIDMVIGRDTPNVKATGGIASLQRKHVALQLLLEHIRTCCVRMNSMAGRLLPRYAGEQEKQLLARRDCVLEAARQLAAEAEKRSRQLDEAERLKKFFLTARCLLDWLAEKKEKMSCPDALSRTIYGVERLVADHRQLFAELSIKVKQIDECLDIGRTILSASESSFGISCLYVDLAGPQGKLRETCVVLATERVITEALWRERWERLAMLLDSRYFQRDAAAAESWLNSREVYLVSVRRSIGDTLAETLALLGAHYAFEKACASAEEKFAALKRLTKLEIHALEWKPEDAKRHEKQKRENIRRAVHEFLPPSHTYTRPSAAKKNQPTRLTTSSPGSRDPIIFEEKPAEVPPMVPQGTRQSCLQPFGAPLLSGRPLPLMRTVPLPHKCTSRASLPLVAVAKQDIVEEEDALRPSSSSTTRVTSPRTPLDEIALMTQPFQDLEEGKTIETTSSTRPQGSFPSTTAHTPPLSRKIAVPEEDATLIGVTTTAERFPRVEGPLVRKWDFDAGGERHVRGRGWTSTYVTLLDGKMTFYKDRRTCREQQDETLRGEPALDLKGAIALPALDYAKRQFVFRLKLLSGAEYLLQAVNDEILQRWVDAINDSASKMAANDLAQRPERARSHSATSHHSRILPNSQQRQQKRPHSSFRRILKRS
uniref:PH domain-containing protein n=1 Tax=Mesocestoides corti TaxID=53468 RepID=A0A5K3EXK4_MESCO